MLVKLAIYCGGDGGGCYRAIITQSPAVAEGDVDAGQPIP
jgi:hypothetical protein